MATDDDYDDDADNADDADADDGDDGDDGDDDDDDDDEASNFAGSEHEIFGSLHVFVVSMSCACIFLWFRCCLHGLGNFLTRFSSNRFFPKQ